MTDIKVRIEGDERLKALAHDPAFIRGPLKDFLESSAGVIQREAKQRAPADTGHLRASIYAKVELHPAAQSIASVGPTVFYAPYVEYGTRPHWPPVKALQPWARRHGFGPRGAFALAAAIAKRGTRPHPFMAPAVEASISAIHGFLETLGQAIRARWSR